MDLDRELNLRRGLADTTRAVLGDDDSPLGRVRAARQVAMVAASDFASAVADARRAGLAWEEIAAAVPSFPATYGDRAAEALFEHLAAPGSHGWSYVGWWCADCGGRVLDRGPYGGHTDDAEPGHAEDCPRRRAQVLAYEEGLGREAEPEPPPTARRRLGGRPPAGDARRLGR